MRNYKIGWESNVTYLLCVDLYILTQIIERGLDGFGGFDLS